jgi:hypothetical protein
MTNKNLITNNIEVIEQWLNDNISEKTQIVELGEETHITIELSEMTYMTLCIAYNSGHFNTNSYPNGAKFRLFLESLIRKDKIDDILND